MALNCYAAKAFNSEISDHSTQDVHAWPVSKTKFVNPLSTKVVNNLEKFLWLQRKACHGMELFFITVISQAHAS